VGLLIDSPITVLVNTTFFIVLMGLVAIARYRERGWLIIQETNSRRWNWLLSGIFWIGWSTCAAFSVFDGVIYVTQIITQILCIAHPEMLNVVL